MSMLRTVCPADKFTPEDAPSSSPEDPLEIFLGCLYDAIKTNAADKRGGGRGGRKNLFRGLSVNDVEGYGGASNGGNGGGCNGATGGGGGGHDGEGSGRTRAHSIAGRDGGLMLQQQHSVDEKMMSGADLALSKDISNSANSMRRSSVHVATVQNTYNVAREGPLSASTPGIDKCTVTLSDIMELAHGHYDFQIRLQLEQFNWSVKRPERLQGSSPDALPRPVPADATQKGAGTRRLGQDQSSRREQNVTFGNSS